eukprot:TRINITY_DN631_c0_g1_i1.p1 TRINITY_DN631_c0_g1~~TRINITY_DN631_c0_g1_i1.p1  ORF type:complete len:485 (-),score=105.10 TRINITY_DN631_c0_g1_i1:53-1483(-)
MSHVILAPPQNTRAAKAMIAAQFNGVAVEYPSDFSMKDGQHLTPEFLALNPFHQVPTLRTPEGGVFESNSIARHVARKGQANFPLYGASEFEASRIDSFLDVAMGYDTAVSPWYYRLVGYYPRDAAVEKEAQEKVKKILTGLELALKGKDTLVGNSITLADICVATAVGTTLRKVGNAEFVAEFPNVVRFIKAMLALPQFVAVLGEADWSTLDAPAPATRADACALPGCGKPASGACGQCRITSYCCKTCQSNDWAAHRKICGKSVKPILHGLPLSHATVSVLLLLSHTGAPVEMKPCDLMAGAHLKPEFLAMNPRHSIPTLEVGNFAIWESGAILRYLANVYAPQLYPADHKTRAWIDCALEYRNGTLFGIIADLTYPLMGWNKNTEKIEPAMAKLPDVWITIRHFLAGRPFIAGDDLSIADFAICSHLEYLAINSAVVLPEDIKAYIDRFLAASRKSAEALEPLRSYRASKAQQ